MKTKILSTWTIETYFSEFIDYLKVSYFGYDFWMAFHIFINSEINLNLTWILRFEVMKGRLLPFLR